MTSEMKKACVIGWPIAHSRSPLIHGYWIERHGLNAAYEKVAVRPEELEDFLLDLPNSPYRGCNITVPHKEKAFEIIERVNPAGLSPLARKLKAINTVWIENGRLYADNTDVYGFMANFRSCVPDWSPDTARVLVIGAGGAARAVVAGFLDAGVRSVSVANRTVEKAERLVEELGAHEALPLSDLNKALSRFTVLVNTTVLGMKGQPPLDLSLQNLPEDAIVADIVYVPLITPLLAAARARGLRTVEGLGMLLHQAVPGFERWFGIKPAVTEELHARIAADIEKEDGA